VRGREASSLERPSPDWSPLDRTPVACPTCGVTITAGGAGQQVRKRHPEIGCRPRSLIVSQARRAAEASRWATVGGLGLGANPS
jgi:hypothetical protein